MPETISEERLRELEGQCGDGSFDDGYGFHGGNGEGLSLSELRALIAGYREAHAIPSPQLRAFMDKLKDLPEDELGERLANLGVQ